MSEIGENSGAGDDNDENNCADQAKKIDEFINRNKHEHDNKGTHGLVHRFRELLSNMGKQIRSGVLTNEARQLWQTHYDQITGLQGKLQRLLKKYQNDGCGDPPAGAWSWSEREVPTYQQAASEAGVSLRDVAVAGGAVGAGYLIYRIVRFLPSLLPPLWETIPANLAIP